MSGLSDSWTDGTNEEEKKPYIAAAIPPELIYEAKDEFH